jgi:hypothetical protein
VSDFLGVKFGNLATKQKGLSHKYKGLFLGEKSGPLSPHYEEKQFEVTILTNELPYYSTIPKLFYCPL